MAFEPPRPVALSFTSAALLTLSQAAVGCGLGLLLAGKMDDRKRNAAALGMMCLAAGATVSAGAGVLTDLVSGPRSRLGVRRRLRTIRGDSGFHHAGEEVF